VDDPRAGSLRAARSVGAVMGPAVLLNRSTAVPAASTSQTLDNNPHEAVILTILPYSGLPAFLFGARLIAD
jgi:hypothetical protein